MDGESEVVFREEDDPVEVHEDEPALPTHVTTSELAALLRSWDDKFMTVTECLRKVQINSDRVCADICMVGQDARGQSQEQERRLENMQEELSDFMRRVENNGNLIAPHTLRASTPHRGYQPSPVSREEVLHSELNTLPHTQGARTDDQIDSMEMQMGSARTTLPHSSSARTEELCVSRDIHTRDQDDALRDTRNTLPHISSARTEELRVSRDTRTRDQDDALRDTRNTLPYASSARTEEQLAFRDTHTRDQHDAVRDTRTKEYIDDRHARVRDIQFRLDERPRRVPLIQVTLLPFYAPRQAQRFRRSMEQIQPSLDLG